MKAREAGVLQKIPPIASQEMLRARASPTLAVERVNLQQVIPDRRIPYKKTKTYTQYEIHFILIM